MQNMHENCAIIGQLVVGNVHRRR